MMAKRKTTGCMQPLAFFFFPSMYSQSFSPSCSSCLAHHASIPCRSRQRQAHPNHIVEHNPHQEQEVCPLLRPFSWLGVHAPLEGQQHAGAEEEDGPRQGETGELSRICVGECGTIRVSREVSARQPRQFTECNLTSCGLRGRRRTAAARYPSVLAPGVVWYGLMVQCAPLVCPEPCRTNAPARSPSIACRSNTPVLSAASSAISPRPTSPCACSSCVSASPAEAEEEATVCRNRCSSLAGRALLCPSSASARKRTIPSAGPLQFGWCL